MSQEKKCSTCNGYGLWAMGDATPMGRIDAEDGYPTLPCPECGANPNPMPEEQVRPTKKTYLVLVTNRLTQALTPHEQELAIAIQKLGISTEVADWRHKLRFELHTPLTRIQVRELHKLKDEMGRICDFYEEESEL